MTAVQMALELVEKFRTQHPGKRISITGGQVNVVDATPEEEAAYLKERGMLNVEIKARCEKELHAEFQKTVLGRGGWFNGCDHQIDTYFNVPMGRLKLREGTIENFLVQYSRPDQAGPKISQFRLVKNPKDSGLKEALTAALGVLAVVDKWRDIYWIDNVKIHFDTVTDLGTFVEIEAQDKYGTMTVDKLREQTDQLIAAFGIKPEHLISESYSDMILKSVSVGTKITYWIEGRKCDSTVSKVLSDNLVQTVDGDTVALYTAVPGHGMAEHIGE